MVNFLSFEDLLCQVEFCMVCGTHVSLRGCRAATPGARALRYGLVRAADLVAPAQPEALRVGYFFKQLSEFQAYLVILLCLPHIGGVCVCWPARRETDAWAAGDFTSSICS